MSEVLRCSGHVLQAIPQQHQSDQSNATITTRTLKLRGLQGPEGLETLLSGELDALQPAEEEKRVRVKRHDRCRGSGQLESYRQQVEVPVQSGQQV
ncbi:hypothetical protein EYF80_036835 [Liparis tanakae]|uniref:Uncharacterized protein n=1 Tax=Liparis tanakae TaxID=230148 RepID=A0A4Z2GI11_9TELE|nr:hypothetical protein EYF80_036835 [Liparis tanakae]